MVAFNPALASKHHVFFLAKKEKKSCFLTALHPSNFVRFLCYMAFLFCDSLPFNDRRILQASIKALELLLLSAGLVSTLVMVKGAVVMPYSCEFVFSSLLGFWNSIKCFLSSSLYICIIINFIVVLIKVSSTFHRHENHQDDHHDLFKFSDNIVDDDDMQIAESPSPPPTPPSGVAGEVTPHPSPPRNSTKVGSPATLSSRTRIPTRSTTREQLCDEKASLSTLAALFSNEAEIKKTVVNSSSSQDSSSSQRTKAKEKTATTTTTTNLPPLSRKGKKDHYDKENVEEDTMEATWKAITGEGKQRAKKKQLKKSEMWDVPPRRSTGGTVRRLDSEELFPSSPKWKELRKSETFNDSVSMTCRGGLRRDPSMSLEEFNQQVEAFIKKFNDDMRLQRQESDQRILDMIRKGI